MELNMQSNFESTYAQHAKMAKNGRQDKWNFLWLLSNQSSILNMQYKFGTYIHILYKFSWKLFTIKKVMSG